MTGSVASSIRTPYILHAIRTSLPTMPWENQICLLFCSKYQNIYIWCWCQKKPVCLHSAQKYFARMMIPKAAKCKPYFGSYNLRAGGSVSCHNVKSWIFSVIFSSPKLSWAFLIACCPSVKNLTLSSSSL